MKKTLPRTKPTLSFAIASALTGGLLLHCFLLDAQCADAQPGYVPPAQPGQPFYSTPGQAGFAQQLGQAGFAQPGQAGFAQPGAPYQAQPGPGYLQTGVQPGMSEAMRRMYSGQGPLVVPPITFVDVNSGRFGKLEIDLEDGQFLEGACDNLHLIARNMDLREGILKSLDVSVTGGHFQDFIVDKLTMTTQGAMRFDTGVLFNQKVLQFIEPTQADVTCEISQDSLNKFLNAPSTLNRLSVSATNKVGAIAGMFGVNAPQVGLSLSNGQLVLGKNNQIDITLQSKIGVGEMGMAFPIEVQSQLALVDGWVQAQDTKLLTSGQEISPQLSQMLLNKINSLASWGTKSDDIHFRFTDLKMKPGKGFVLKGTAEVMRLRFGRQ